MAHKKKPKIKSPTRSEVIVIRVTPDELVEIQQKAKDSGKSVSSVGRHALLGMKLYSRLTDKQCDALCSLTDARADIVNIRNVLKKTPEDIKTKLFRNPKFMTQWLLGADKVVEGCDKVLSNLYD